AIAQLCRAYDKYGKGIVGIKEVSTKEVMKYDSMKLEALEDGCFEISDMIEKPLPEQIFSNYSILGRCILPPEIFDILENTPTGKGGELQLTDAMKTLSNRETMIGVDFTGTRYDMGNKLSALKASIETGLRNPETAEELRKYIKQLAETI
ncbi:MAG: UTP--glucose-1-phosphate uridylyltransferase, partial [Oscillospiraceae bacterium]|nr:UTP--glucose-1-phosphate uridylyltransferase [Oscillospiraceae bacterium]